MSKYAVAVLSFFDNKNEVKIVEANNERDALILATEESLDVDFLDEFETIDELIQYYIDGEISVSRPVKL